MFDAKGIETVRRDTCPAVAKMLEATLRLLFTSKDLSQVGAQPLGGWVGGAGMPACPALSSCPPVARTLRSSRA